MQIVLIKLINSIGQAMKGLSETWLSPFSLNVEIPGDNLIHVDRKNWKGGDVGMYINEKLKYNWIEEITCDEAKCCGIEVLVRKQQILVVSLYRPPNGCIPSFNRSFKKMVDAWKRENKKVIVCTDHNLDFLKTDKHTHTHTNIHGADIWLKITADDYETNQNYENNCNLNWQHTTRPNIIKLLWLFSLNR